MLTGALLHRLTCRVGTNLCRLAHNEIGLTGLIALAGALPQSQLTNLE